MPNVDRDPSLRSPEMGAEHDFRHYSLKPILIEAAQAHQEGMVTYDENGVVTLRHPDLKKCGLEQEQIILPSKQFPLIRPCFDDINPKLSNLANSPLVDGQTLRQRFEAESGRYDEMAMEAYVEGKWEPDYGTYVFDHTEGNLYLIAPEYWHRLSLVLSNSKLLTDPEGKLSWQETRQRLEGAVVGFAGASVGSGILEGWFRNARPKQTKIADLDVLEFSNLNRVERSNIRFLGQSRATRFVCENPDDDIDPKNPFNVRRFGKVDSVVYQQHLVDPYAQIFVYGEGVNRGNMERFLLGNGKDEPRIDILVEETDKFRLKVELRDMCRRFGIPVLMYSDFAHRSQVLFQDFAKNPLLPLAPGVSDEVTWQRLDKAEQGDRTDAFAFMETICGPHYAADEFKQWVNGEGEQMGASLPQLGSTAEVTGGEGGEFLTNFVLGWKIPKQKRETHDIRHGEIIRE